MRKIANAIDSAPKVRAAVTRALLGAYKPMAKKSAAVQKTRIAIRDPRHRPARDLKRNQEPRLFDHAGVLVGGRQRRLLRVSFWLKRRQKVADALRIGEGRAYREHRGVDGPAAPDRPIGFLDSRFELVAHRLGLGAKLPERLIEPQDLGGEILEVRPLSREIPPAHANEGSEDQREKKADQPRDLADHGFRLARLVLIDEPRLQSEAGVAGDHEQDENKYADKKNAHCMNPPALVMPHGAPYRPFAEIQARSRVRRPAFRLERAVALHPAVHCTGA